MRVFPKQEWRIGLLILASFLVLPPDWWGDQLLGAWMLILHARVHDDAKVLTLGDEWHFERYLMHIDQESGVDVRFVVVPSLVGQSLEEYSVRKARELGVGREVDRRGLLFVYDVAGQRLRIEVGAQLEGVITDAFAGYLMREHVRSFFGTGTPSLGLRTTMFMVHNRIRRAAMGEEFDPRFMQYIDDSRRLAVGGGASASMRLYQASAFLNRERTSDRATRTHFSPQPTPKAAYERYLEWLARGKYETDVPLFTPLSQEYLATLTMTPAYNDYMLAGEYGRPYEVLERGDLALIYFTGDPLTSPHFLRRDSNGWMIDMVAEVLDTRNYEGGAWTWGLLNTQDDFTQTFGDQYVTIGAFLRLAGGDNRPLPSRAHAGGDPAKISLPVAAPASVLAEVDVSEAAERIGAAGRPAMVLLYSTTGRQFRETFSGLAMMAELCRRGGSKVLAFSIDESPSRVRELPAFLGMSHAPFPPVRILPWESGQFASEMAPLGIQIAPAWSLPLVAVRTADGRVVQAEGAEMVDEAAESILEACSPGAKGDRTP